MRWLQIGALTLVVFAIGCGNGDRSARITRTATEAKTTKDGHLTRTPPPLSANDIDRLKRGSPEQAVMLLWFYAQWGSAPSIVSLYDDRVLETIGGENVAGAYAQNRPNLLQTRPRITGRRRTPVGTLLTVELLSKDAVPRIESVTLRQRGPDWRVVHDTFFESIVAGYVQSVAQARINPLAKTPPVRAVSLGAQATRRYRSLFANPDR